MIQILGLVNFGTQTKVCSHTFFIQSLHTLSVLFSTFSFGSCGRGGGAVMETAPYNDTTHGSFIIVTIMGLDGITGGQLGVLGEP